MSRSQRIEIWNELAQANLPLDDVVDRALARAEMEGCREALRRQLIHEALRGGPEFLDKHSALGASGAIYQSMMYRRGPL